jgi:hypothetical protein
MEYLTDMTQLLSSEDLEPLPVRPKSLLLLPLLRAVARVCAYLDKEPYYDGRFNSCDPG